ncbi:MAG: aspartate--tRNA(Asn) ligase [Candidatus Thermoplasmatota archaeon]|nr:aspartate--tRNA(Asn) ligase [Candidatus Thermoplasmatota archaeon]
MPSWQHVTYSREISSEHYGQQVTVGGWVQDLRNLGGISFLQLRDAYGVIQVTMLKKRNKEIFEQVASIPRESVVLVSGIVKESKEAKAGYEILPDSVTVVNAAEAPLPLGVVDKVGADLDTRLNNRFLDLRKEEIRAIFKIKARTLEGIRNYLTSQNFTEVSTPKIVAAGAEGGATLFPIKYFDKNAYLAQSPQLYKQNLMASGLDKIFEIAPAYRAEASDTIRHIAEFTSLDVELAFIKSSDDVMDVAEGIVVSSLKHVREKCKKELEILGIDIEDPAIPFPKVKYDEAIEMLASNGLKIAHGEDLGTEGEKLLGDIMMKDRGIELYFITEFPTSLKRSTFYAKRNDLNPELTGYFDLDYRGQEIVSGGQREHRYDVLSEQMRENNLNLDSFEFYLKAFRYGMPPHGGFGFGVERYVQKMLDLPNIRETVLYPRDRLRLTP